MSLCYPALPVDMTEVLLCLNKRWVNYIRAIVLQSLYIIKNVLLGIFSAL